MTQLIASYELAIGCESTATLSPFQPSIARASFWREYEDLATHHYVQFWECNRN